jgi:hypothetical protein
MGAHWYAMLLLLLLLMGALWSAPAAAAFLVAYDIIPA